MDVDIKIMSDEEKRNPTLLFERDNYKDAPVCYFGSKKSVLRNICLSCYKKDSCYQYKDITNKAELIKASVNNPDIGMSLTIEEKEKLRNNVFIVIECPNYIGG